MTTPTALSSVTKRSLSLLGFAKLATALLFASACASPHPPGAVPRLLPSPRTPQPLEGIYVICSGAYAHSESLTLRGSTFQHFIRTHGIYGNRSSGTYAQLGDTLVLEVGQQGPVPQGVQRPITLNYNFVIGEHARFRVLWRGTDEAKRATSQPSQVSQYSALFYSGADSAQLQVPSCNEVRGRLRGGAPSQ